MFKVLKQALAAVLAAAALLAAPLAHAGRTCEERPLNAQSLRQALSFAERTQRALDATGARVVVLGRVGQDLSSYGLRYSHLGLAYRTPEGWRVTHKLNHCGTAEASLFRQGLGDFFLDDVFAFEAAWSVPTPQVQELLLAALNNEQSLAAMHTRDYNMLAYPWATKYQQSNQWLTETLAFAVAPSNGIQVSSRAQAQAWLQLQGYQPTVLKLGPVTRLGARATRANVQFDDHPNDKRFSDRIETTSADSVFAWLERSRLGGPMQVLR